MAVSSLVSGPSLGVPIIVLLVCPPHPMAKSVSGAVVNAVAAVNITAVVQWIVPLGAAARRSGELAELPGPKKDARFCGCSCSIRDKVYVQSGFLNIVKVATEGKRSLFGGGVHWRSPWKSRRCINCPALPPDNCRRREQCRTATCIFLVFFSRLQVAWWGG